MTKNRTTKQKTPKQKFGFESWVAKKKPKQKKKKVKRGAFTLLCNFCGKNVPIYKKQVTETTDKRLILRLKCPFCKNKLKFVKSSPVFNRQGWIAVDVPLSPALRPRIEEIDETVAQLHRRRD